MHSIQRSLSVEMETDNREGRARELSRRSAGITSAAGASASASSSAQSFDGASDCSLSSPGDRGSSPGDRGSFPSALADSSRAKVRLQKVAPEIYRQWVKLSQATQSLGLPFHGALKSRREASADALFQSFQGDVVRHFYLTWARNVWRIGALRRMNRNMIVWRNGSIMSAFVTWATTAHQLNSLRALAHRLHVHGQSHGREHCYQVWRKATLLVKKQRHRAARLLIARIYRATLLAVLKSWRKIGSIKEQELQVLNNVKRMWVNPVLLRTMEAWRALVRDHKVSNVNAKVLAAWAGATQSTYYMAWKTLVHEPHISSRAQAQRPAAVDRLHLQINRSMEENILGKCPGLPLNPHRLNTKLAPPHVPLLSPMLARLRELGWRGKVQQEEMNLDQNHSRDVRGLPSFHSTRSIRFPPQLPVGSCAMRASAALSAATHTMESLTARGLRDTTPGGGGGGREEGGARGAGTGPNTHTHTHTHASSVSLKSLDLLTSTVTSSRGGARGEGGGGGGGGGDMVRADGHWGLISRVSCTTQGEPMDLRHWMPAPSDIDTGHTALSGYSQSIGYHLKAHPARDVLVESRAYAEARERDTLPLPHETATPRGRQHAAAKTRAALFLTMPLCVHMKKMSALHETSRYALLPVMMMPPFCLFRRSTRLAAMLSCR
jgi:hypothetical protein